MNFENFQDNVPAEDKRDEEKIEKVDARTGGVGKWLKKTVALTGVAGIGFFGSMNDASATEGSASQGQIDTKPEQTDSKEKINLTETVYQSPDYNWNIEYLDKTEKNHGEGSLIRYVRVDNKTGESVTVGEYNNLFEASEGLKKIEGVPESVKKLVDHELSAVKTEQAFKKSGLVDTREFEGQSKRIHTEERPFKGYGIDVVTSVQVNEKGEQVGVQGFKDVK
jgi:hypothetical protein